MDGRRNKFTAEQDELILAHKPAEIAKRLGLTTEQVKKRKYALMQKGAHSAPAAPARRALPLPFARPSWFKENLFAMTKGGLRQ